MLNAHPSLQAFQPPTEVRQFGGGDKNHVQLLHHDARELEILLLLQNLGEGPIYSLRVEVETELSDDQTASGVEETTICAEELQEVVHEQLEVTFLRT